MIFDDLDKKIGESKYFTWAEALWINKMQAFVKPTAAQIEGIKKQALELDKVRAFFGKPMTVTSWLRPLAYNKLIGGAPASMHMTGLATDFVIKGLDIEFVKKTLQAEGKKLYSGRGEVNTTNWIHLDLKNNSWFKG